MPGWFAAGRTAMLDQRHATAIGVVVGSAAKSSLSGAANAQPRLLIACSMRAVSWLRSSGMDYRPMKIATQEIAVEAWTGSKLMSFVPDAIDQPAGLNLTTGAGRFLYDAFGPYAVS